MTYFFWSEIFFRTFCDWNEKNRSGNTKVLFWWNVSVKIFFCQMCFYYTFSSPKFHADSENHTFGYHFSSQFCDMAAYMWFIWAFWLLMKNSWFETCLSAIKPYQYWRQLNSASFDTNMKILRVVTLEYWALKYVFSKLFSAKCTFSIHLLA